MSNLFLFTGDNTYALHEELSRWCREFTAKYGEENQQRIDAQTIDYRELLDDLSSAPFLAAKRLLIIRGLPSWSKEQVAELAAQIHPDCIAVFVEGRIDKRLVGTKEMLATATVKTFPHLSDRDLRVWITSHFQSRNATIDPDALELLLSLVGSDQHMLDQEIEKLTLGAGHSAITTADVVQLCLGSGEQEVWALTDSIIAGRRTEAFRLLQRLLSRGEDAFSIWNILLWMLRSITAVAAAYNDGARSLGSIASSAGVHPQAVRKMVTLVEKSDLTRLRALIDWVAEAEQDLKTGGYRSTQDAQQELLGLIDACVLRSVALATR